VKPRVGETHLIRVLEARAGLTEEAQIHRGVAAVLTLLQSGGLTSRPQAP